VGYLYLRRPTRIRVSSAPCEGDPAMIIINPLPVAVPSNPA
jgi:hypothetical protein